MTPERAHAYRRVVKTLRELGPSKLLPDEQERIREGADHLIFTPELETDSEAWIALVEVEQLCRDLVESDRWEYERAMRLADDVASCGPALAPQLLAA